MYLCVVSAFLDLEENAYELRLDIRAGHDEK